MKTRKDPAETPISSTDNSLVDNVPGQTTVNEYLRLPSVLLIGFRDDMKSYLQLHPEPDGGIRTIRLRMLDAIINNPQPAPERPIETADTTDAALRARLKTAEKLLKEAEPLVAPATSSVNTRVKHVIAGTLEWRIGGFLQGTWPREGEQ